MWSVAFLDERVVAEIGEQPADIRAAFERVVRLIHEIGLERGREPYVKHLEGRLWEMRLKGKDGIARAIYVTASQRRIVVIRVFTKKSEKTPPRELEVARQRAKEVI